MDKELDFMIEMENSRETKRNFKGDDNIYVPEVYEEYCSSRVLTMEYVEGVKINDYEGLDKKLGFDAI